CGHREVARRGSWHNVGNSGIAARWAAANAHRHLVSIPGRGSLPASWCDVALSRLGTSVREVSWSFRRIFETWNRAVDSETTRCLAIDLFECPSDNSAATSRSRLDRKSTRLNSSHVSISY